MLTDEESNALHGQARAAKGEHMKYLIFIVALLASSAHADFYIKIGTGYKFMETDELTVEGVDYTIDYADPISARIEIGQEQGNW